MDKAFVITRARLAKGLTQAELANMARTSQATLSAYERGVKSPSLKVLWRILWVKGVRPGAAQAHRLDRAPPAGDREVLGAERAVGGRAADLLHDVADA